MVCMSSPYLVGTRDIIGDKCVAGATDRSRLPIALMEDWGSGQSGQKRRRLIVLEPPKPLQPCTAARATERTDLEMERTCRTTELGCMSEGES